MDPERAGVNFIRSALFMLWATLVTISVVPPIMLAAVFGKKAAYAMVWLYRRAILFGSRWMLGIIPEVRGQEHIPDEPCVFLAKHQSAWETVALQEIVPPGSYPVFVVKKELLSFPFIGWGMAALRFISIDRKAKRDALAQVVEQGCDRLKNGYTVIIFPEGTRVAPGEKKTYQPGGAFLAKKAGCKAVPIAQNVGELWPRNAFIKRPGKAIISIGPAIDPAGLTGREINRRAEEWIEAEMRRLSPHLYPEALQPLENQS